MRNKLTPPDRGVAKGRILNALDKDTWEESIRVREVREALNGVENLIKGTDQANVTLTMEHEGATYEVIGWKRTGGKKEETFIGWLEKDKSGRTREATYQFTLSQGGQTHLVICQLEYKNDGTVAAVTAKIGENHFHIVRGLDDRMIVYINWDPHLTGPEKAGIAQELVKELETPIKQDGHLGPDVQRVNELYDRIQSMGPNS